MRSKNHDDAMAEYYRENPDFAIDRINQLLVDSEPGEFAIVLRQLAIAFPHALPHIQPITEDTLKIGPLLADFVSLLNALHLTLRVSPQSAAPLHPESQAA